jgi:hypothetical protein
LVGFSIHSKGLFFPTSSLIKSQHGHLSESQICLPAVCDNVSCWPFLP